MTSIPFNDSPVRLFPCIHCWTPEVRCREYVFLNRTSCVDCRVSHAPSPTASSHSLEGSAPVTNEIYLHSNSKEKKATLRTKRPSYTTASCYICWTNTPKTTASRTRRSTDASREVRSYWWKTRSPMRSIISSAISQPSTIMFATRWKGRGPRGLTDGVWVNW
jgi:hypothetical protein